MHQIGCASRAVQSKLWAQLTGRARTRDREPGDEVRTCSASLGRYGFAPVRARLGEDHGRERLRPGAGRLGECSCCYSHRSPRMG